MAECSVCGYESTPTGVSIHITTSGGGGHGAEGERGVAEVITLPEEDSHPNKNDLLQELKRLRSVLDKTPSGDDINAHGEFDRHHYRRVFGTVASAVRDAGMWPLEPDEEDLVRDLRQAADHLEKTPTTRELKKHAQYTRKTYERKFGSYDEAVRNAGLEPNEDGRKKSVSDDEMLQDLIRVSSLVTEWPRSRDYEEHGRYAIRQFYRRFGSWAGALDAADIEHPPFPLSGKDDPRTEEGTPPKPYDNSLWFKRRREVFVRDRDRCTRCGLLREVHKKQYGVDLHVHHITPRKQFDSYIESNKLSNLRALCIVCHNIVERQT